MNNRQLGIIAFLCAPYLCLSFLLDEQDRTIWQQGLYGLIYMAGWMCSIYALYKINAANKTILKIQLGFLTIAQVWNILVIASVSTHNIFFIAGDLFWPLSNLCMLVTGISVIRSKQVIGWKKYIPLVVGCWLPVFFISAMLVGKKGTMPLAAIYSLLAWAFLAIMVYTTKPLRPSFQS